MTRMKFSRSRACHFSAVTVLLVAGLLFPPAGAALDSVNMSIPTKTFQQVIYPIAQERGYMKEEGLELKLVFIEATPSIQSLMAGAIQFTGSGSSALVALAKGSAPLKVVIAGNDRVLQWLLVRPGISSPKDLRGKRIATTGVATAATFMLRQILAKYGLDGNRDVTILDPGSNNQLTALLSGVADAAILGPDQRYIGIDNGMKEMFFFGNEVKNSWGTVATSDRLIKEQPRVVTGFLKATLKALAAIRKDREGTVAAMAKFSGLDRAQAARVYDDLIPTFTSNATVDDETQKNDLVIIRQVAGVQNDIPNARAYDFSFAQDAEKQLKSAGWRP
jgi:NitT/TauT family transport system substrate-binding protein